MSSGEGTVPRHNLCPNPAAGVDVTGWAGSNAPTRAAVAGFVRPFVARYTVGTFLETPRSAATPGQVVTLSLYLRFPNAGLNVSGNSYVAWHRANGSDISFDTAGYTTVVNGVLRVVRTGTAPAETASVSLIVDGPAFSSQTCEVTALLVEVAPGTDTYADGDTAGWVWDGTAGLSPSSESPDVTVTPDSIASTEVVGAPTLTPGAIAVTPDSVASAEVVGSPTLTPGPVTISPASIPSAAAVGSPTVGSHTAPHSLPPHLVGVVRSLPPRPARLPE